MKIVSHLVAIILVGLITNHLVTNGTSGASAFEPSTSLLVNTSAPPDPGFNPSSRQKIELGKKLFFDPLLSGRNTKSCASCHIPEYGWTDRTSRSLGETGVARPRRTPSLQDVGWNTSFARDGRIETLEGFILGPISHPEEMNQNLESLTNELSETQPYPDLFKAAFNAIPSLDAISMSLAAYLRTLRSSQSPFDRWLQGETHAIPPTAIAGYKLFIGKAGCNQCHSGWRFTDQKFHDIGLSTMDKGRGKFEPDNPLAQFAFKTPSLRNVALRPPYMHNGSIATLEDVLAHYQSGIKRRPSLSPQLQAIDLSDQEMVNLIEFLTHLTDDKHLNTLKTAPD